MFNTETIGFRWFGAFNTLDDDCGFEINICLDMAYIASDLVQHANCNKSEKLRLFKIYLNWFR